MLRLQLHQLHTPKNNIPSLFSGTGVVIASWERPPQVSHRLPKYDGRRQRAASRSRIRCAYDGAAGDQQSTVTTSTRAETIAVKAIANVKMTIRDNLSYLSIVRGIDDIGDLLGKTLLLELVSSELDPITGREKETVNGYAHKKSQKGDDFQYECDLKISGDFGEIGGVLVTNEHHKEMFLQDIVITLDDGSGTSLTIPCYSWVHSKFDNPEKRIFFTSKSYLPSETPSGLLRLREKELHTLQGTGEGERKPFERIYDYDVYNDLGNPDKGDDMARPVLGGNKEYPYPRRCRTGRRPSKKDHSTESRSNSVYVPRDEGFAAVKSLTFSLKTFRSVIHGLLPAMGTVISDRHLRFSDFTHIDTLFNDGLELPKNKNLNAFETIIPRLVKSITDGTDNVLRFETPAVMKGDKFSWLKDEQFSRQALAGINPYAIQLVKEFPLVSKLDPDVYGPPESLITAEFVEGEIKGVMTVKQAIEEKRLFMLDYHDLLLPYVNKVRGIQGTTLYASRTLFFLTNDGTLKPIVIELTRPKSPTKPQWKHVFHPSSDATGSWLWKLAKVHVCAHDFGFHELVTHWLRTHCCMEPYVIAAHRRLSAMHPVFRLLHLHFRYTMEINALAREALVSAGGIIETSFSPGKYSMEVSSAAYDQLWRFDMEALPADLIRRGMAEEDPSAEHGLRLAIQDYPFANDGLLVWFAIKDWVKDYVSHYYPDSTLVADDHELQNWWTEVRTKGHADKKDEPWWPKLETREDLISILTSIIWTASGHHAAVNFGQYHFAGYFPNRPAIARANMPVEDPTEESFERFLRDPEERLLDCLPSQMQAVVVMAVIDVLSNHSPDEEYIGKEPEVAWKDDPAIKAAFERFGKRLKDIEDVIDQRNHDLNLKNRCGAGVVPYELLKPFSEPGVTGRGVPNSISI